MAREYPMNPSPDGAPSQTTLQTTASMKAFELPGRGKKEIAPTKMDSVGPKSVRKTGDLGNMTAPTPGKEYRQVS